MIMAYRESVRCKLGLAPTPGGKKKKKKKEGPVPRSGLSRRDRLIFFFMVFILSIVFQEARNLCTCVSIIGPWGGCDQLSQAGELTQQKCLVWKSGGQESKAEVWAGPGPPVVFTDTLLCPLPQLLGVCWHLWGSLAC